MKKIIRLTESDLTRIIKRVLMENDSQLEPNTILLSKDKSCNSVLKLTYDGLKVFDKRPHEPILASKITNAEVFGEKPPRHKPWCVEEWENFNKMVDSGQLINAFIEKPFTAQGAESTTFIYDKNGKEIDWTLGIIDGAENLSNYIKSQKK